MFLDRFINKEARLERKVQNEISLQAGMFAEDIANGVYRDSEVVYFVTGRVPETMSIMAFAKEVGEMATNESLAEITSFDLVRYDPVQTALVNAAKPGVTPEGLDIIPPPPVNVTIIFDRTPTAKAYNF